MTGSSTIRDGVPSASLEEMQAWARELMASRPADALIGAHKMERWWVIPRNEFSNVYLHRMTVSDDDRAMHDHPWHNRSLIISGGYNEHTPEGVFWRGEGDVVDREPEALHFLTVPEGGEVITLFMTGPKVREWGFACPKGWVRWRDFTSYVRDPITDQLTSDRGAGCGEFA